MNTSGRLGLAGLLTMGLVAFAPIQEAYSQQGPETLALRRIARQETNPKVRRDILNGADLIDVINAGEREEEMKKHISEEAEKTRQDYEAQVQALREENKKIRAKLDSMQGETREQAYRKELAALQKEHGILLKKYNSAKTPEDYAEAKRMNQELTKKAKIAKEKYGDIEARIAKQEEAEKKKPKYPVVVQNAGQRKYRRVLEKPGDEVFNINLFIDKGRLKGYCELMAKGKEANYPLWVPTETKKRNENDKMILDDSKDNWDRRRGFVYKDKEGEMYAVQSKK